MPITVPRVSRDEQLQDPVTKTPPILALHRTLRDKSGICDSIPVPDRAKGARAASCRGRGQAEEESLLLSLLRGRFEDCSGTSARPVHLIIQRNSSWRTQECERHRQSGAGVVASCNGSLRTN